MPFCEQCRREWDANVAETCPHCDATPADDDLGATIDITTLKDSEGPQQDKDGAEQQGADKKGADVTVRGDSDSTPVWDDLDQDSGDDQATIASVPIDAAPSKPGSDPDAATIDGGSATFGTQAGGQRRPTIRDLTGVSADPATPTDLRGQSSSGALGPGDSVSIGTENVRLRAHQLGADAPPQQPLDPAMLDYQHADGPWEGGMGQVWKSRQSTLDRHVAIKQIRTDNPSQRDCDKFVSEAVITGSLEHPNIIPVHDLGVDSSGMPFYSMKFVGGLDWDDAREQRDMSEAENLAVLIQVSQAIAFAHSRNVIHMDLKPNNIRLGDFGEVLVMDWGLAARVDGDREIEAGGTPGYMAPELASPYYRKYLNYTPEGRKAKDSDAVDRTLAEATTDPPAGAHSDIYLLGALLYWIVTGSAPHQGKTRFKLLRAAARNEIAPTRRRTELLDIAYKAMATEPSNRYPRATDFIDAVKSYQEHAQSVEIARRASKELKSAEKARSEGGAAAKDLYESYARARHGYENALALWPENDKAKRRLSQTRRVYAEAAFTNGDYDLALSLIEPNSNDDEALRREVLAAQQKRNTRLAWYRTLQYATVGLLAASLIFIAISAYYRELAFDQIAKAKQAEDRAASATALAKEETTRATQARDAATAAEQATVVAKEQAAAFAEQAAESERVAQQATVARTQAETQAAAAEQAAKEQRYFAAVASVRSALSDDGQYAAARVLESYREQLPEERLTTREWNRLERLTNWQAEATELLPANDRLAVAAASTDGAHTLIARATPNGGELFLYKGEAEQPLRATIPAKPLDVALSSDGRYAAVATPALLVWDFERERPVEITSAATPACFAFHPTMSRLLIGGESTRLEQWRFDDDGQAERLSEDGRWHGVPPVAVGYSPDGQFRWSADGEGVIRVWREDQAGRPWSYRHDRVAAGSATITNATMAADGRLAYGCADGSVYEVAGPWSDNADAAENAGWIESQPQRLTGDHDRGVIALRYALGDRALVSASPSEALVRGAPLAEEPVENLKLRRRYHDQPLTSLTIVGDEEAVTADDVGRIVRWRVETPEPEEDLVARPNGAAVTAIWFSPRDRRVISADADGFLRWRDAADADEPIKVFRGHADHANWRAWRVDQPQPMTVTAADDGFVNSWDATTGQLIARTPLEGCDLVTVTESGVLVAAASGKQAFAQQLPDGPRRTLWSGEPRVSAFEPLDTNATRFAVGLRDGQVYLWSASEGRQAIAASNVRPHWRPILSMDYSPTTGALFVGDSGGLITRWQVTNDSASLDQRWELEQPHPVVKLDQSQSGAAIAVQKWAGRRNVLRLTNDQFEAAAAPLIDAAFDAERVLGLGRDGLLRVADGADWRITPAAMRIRAAAPAKPTGLLAEGGEPTLLGPGFVQRWTTDGDTPALVASVRSRPPIIACGAGRDGAGAVAMIDASGWVGETAMDDGATPALTAAIDGEIRAWATTQDPSRPVLAIAIGGSTRIVEWDLPNGQPGRVLRSEIRGDIELLAVAGNAIGFVVRDADGRRAALGALDADADSMIPLPRDQRPVSITVGPGGERFAVVYRNGAGDYAERDGADWRVARFERRDLTSTVFTPDGARLLLGTRSGRIVAIAPELDGAEVRARRLMTFAGHAAPVRVLQYAGDGQTLLSGDAAGGVATHAF